MLLQGQPKDDKPSAVALVRQLGDNSFRKREAAAKALIAMGGPAAVALRDGLQNADLEIRERCAKLLPIVWEADFKNRVEQFKNDATGKGTHSFPGWERFAKFGGNEPALRAEFLKLMIAHKDEVKVFECEISQLGLRYEECLSKSLGLREIDIQILRAGATLSDLQLSTEDLDFWLLVMSEQRAQKAMQDFEQSRLSFFRNLVKEAQSHRHSKDPGKKALLDAVLAASAEAFVAGEDATTILNAFFDVAEAKELKWMAQIAANWLETNRKDRALFDRAISLLAKSGEKRYLETLKPFLSDETILARDFFKDYITQYRDFALGISLQLQGLSPQSFGFTLVVGQGTPKSYSHGFKSQESRAAAFAMYADYLRK